MTVPLLEVRGICKRFPGVQALDDVDLRLRAGEVLAMIGENGAGKSTLMKILAGVLQPDAGLVRVDGAAVTVDSPGRAMDLGIALIHQELNLCDNLTVAGALFLGRELRCGPFLRPGAMHRQAGHWLQRVGLAVDPGAIVARLAPGQRQLVEIARALRTGARVLIMDEPTSSLSQGETARLFEVVRDLRRQGKGVIYISHRLGEVGALADRVMALRDGRNAGELAGADADHARMAAMMVGRQLRTDRRPTHAPGEAVLEVTGLRTRSFPGATVDLVLRRREIVGIAGLLGSGRSELLRALFGIDRALGGAVRLGGQPVRIRSPRQAVRAGIALVPEDRKEQGLLLDKSVRENLSLPSLGRCGTFLDGAFERQIADRAVVQLAIATPDTDRAVRDLSGGNQQKVVLGKWLATEPRVLLLDEPTRGIDVGARQEIHDRLHALADAGLGVLFASSEMEEVLTLADRVLVMAQGRITGELARAALTEEAVMMLATQEGSR